MQQASFSPFFSIIIPTYNRPECLATCLESLAHLDYPRSSFEVIVVDDGSSVSLKNIIDNWRHQLDIRLIVQNNAGPATARNTGAEQAKGNFYVFTDDDCLLAPNYLKLLAAQFTNTPDALIGGRTLNALPNNLYSTSSQALIDYLYEYYNNRSRLNFFTSNNFALPALLFQKLSGFDASFPTSAAEDREFCDRWLHHGYKMIYASSVCVYHSHELNLLSFWQQHFKYGRGAFCYHKIRARRNQKQIQVEPKSFYWNLLTYPISQSLNLQKLLISVLFFVSQVANVAGFFWEREKQNLSVNKFARVLTLIFFILSFIGVINHEIWGDEAQAWLIARDSVSLLDLRHNLQYEGHPALWHICLFIISRFTHNPLAMQIFHILTATAAIYIFLAFSPFTKLQKLLFTFGYFPFYEYNLISRNYSLGILFIFLFCLYFTAQQKNYLALTVIIVLLANTNPYSFLIACSLLVTLVLDIAYTYKGAFWKYIYKNKLYLYFAISMIGILLAIKQIIPPENAVYQGDDIWKKPDIFLQVKRFALTLRLISKSYIPIPDLFTYHFWNSSIVEVSDLTKLLGTFASILLLLFSTAIFIHKPIVLGLYLSVSLELLFMTYFKYLGGVRHYGHLFIIFVACLWISKYYPNTFSLNHSLAPISRFSKKWLNSFFITILCIQTAVGLYAFSLDLFYPFSASEKTADYIATNHLLQDKFIIGTNDYKVSSIAAYLNTKIYYPESRNMGSFINWNNRSNIDTSTLVSEINQVIDQKGKDAILILTEKLNIEMPSLKVTKLPSFHQSIVEREIYNLYLVTKSDF